MPVYNAEKHLSEAIDSILQQSYPHLEFLIFDDGSTDDSPKIISAKKDTRIRFFPSDKNLGYLSHLNKGIEISKGEFIARMDADDISHPQRFEKQINFLLQHPDHAIVGCDFHFINDSGKRINIKKPFFPTDNATIQISSIFYNPFVHPSVMIRKKYLMDLNLRYDPDFYITEDYHLWTRLLSKRKGHNLKDDLFSYRIHPNQITKTKNQKQRKGLEKLIPCILEYKKIPFDQQDIQTHKNIPLSLRHELSLEEIESIEKRLLQIRNHLIKFPKTKQEIIDHVLSHIWLYSCRKGKGIGWPLYRTFINSPLFLGEIKKEQNRILLLALFGKNKIFKKIKDRWI